MTKEAKMLAVVDAALRWACASDADRDLAEDALMVAVATYQPHAHAHTEADAETVEVRVNLWRNAASGDWCPVMAENDDDDPERDRSWQHIATLTASIPLPSVPTIPATVTREGGQ